MSDYDSGYMDGKAVMYERIAELEMLNREHLKTIARDDYRLAELHDKTVDMGKANNAYAERILEQDKRIAELEQELAIGVNVIRDYEERITELESDNRRMKKVMQRYIDSQDNAKNNWVLDFLQVLEEQK